MPSEARRRLILALEMASRLAGSVGIFKIGKQLLTAEGPEAVRNLSRFDLGIFLDLKFHDIPNTVAGAVSAACSLPGFAFLTVHALGGRAMMNAASLAAVTAHSPPHARPKVLGVTLLTSPYAAVMREIRLTGTPVTRAVHLARLARRGKLDGVVASPK